MVLFTVIILSEGRFDQLAKCLESITPGDVNWQLVISCQGLEVPASILQKAQTTDVQLLDCPPSLTTAEIRNRALEMAEGEWIHFLEEEGSWSKDYYSTLAGYLKDPKIAVVGGPELPRRGINLVAHALALSLSSPFCSGPTFPRYRSLGEALTRSNEQKLSSANIWFRKNHLSENPFPSDYQQKDMSSLIQHLGRTGHGVYYAPNLSVSSQHSFNLLQFRKKIFTKGYERSLLVREKLVSNSVVFTFPTLFVMAHLLLLISPAMIWPLYKLYLILTAVVSVGLSFRARKPWIFPLVFLFHYFIVWEYGWGFLFERISHWWKRWTT